MQLYMISLPPRKNQHTDKDTNEGMNEEMGVPTWTEDVISLYLMSSNFRLMVLPSVLKAAEVFCPAVDRVSDVFLELAETFR